MLSAGIAPAVHARATAHMRACQRDQVLWSRFSKWRHDDHLGGVKP